MKLMRLLKPGIAVACVAAAAFFSCDLYGDQNGRKTAGAATNAEAGLSSLYVPAKEFGTLLFQEIIDQDYEYDENGSLIGGPIGDAPWIEVDRRGSNFDPAVKNYKLTLERGKTVAILLAEAEDEAAVLSFSFNGTVYAQGVFTSLPDTDGVITVTVDNEDGTSAVYTVHLVRVSGESENNQENGSKNDSATIMPGNPSDGNAAALKALSVPAAGFGELRDFNGAARECQLVLNIGARTSLIIAAPADENAVVRFSLNGKNYPQGFFTDIPLEGGVITVTVNPRSGQSETYAVRISREVLDRADFENTRAALEELSQYLAALESAGVATTQTKPVYIRARGFTLANPRDFADNAVFQGAFESFLNLDLSESIVGTASGDGAFTFARIEREHIPAVMKIVELTLPANISAIADSPESGQGVFSDYIYLRKVRVPGAARVGARAFDSCVNLEEIILSRAGEIGERAFASCFALKTLVLGEGPLHGAGAALFDKIPESSLKKLKIYRQTGAAISAVDKSSYWGEAAGNSAGGGLFDGGAIGNGGIILSDLPF